MASVIPTYLRCEYLTSPLAVSTTSPRLSWVLQAADPAQRGLRQTAYQILVASTAEGLAADRPDLWDSGKVTSDRTNQIGYEGKPLRSGQPAWWQVRSWDENNDVSDWSEPATWAVGLVQPSDWQARWIGAPTAVDIASPGPSPLMRKEFSVSGPVKRATAYASALGLYELHLNGQRVGDQVLAPEWTDYNKRVQYQAYDVTDLIRDGANAIGAMLAEGWYAGRIGLTHIVKDGPIRHIYGNRPKAARAAASRTGRWNCPDDHYGQQWKYTVEGPVRTADLLDGEVYDARREAAGWDAAGFDDAPWKPADVLDEIPARLVAQPNEPMRVRHLKPASVSEPTPRRLYL